jgi:uncharacterized protein (TIGR03083 family)
MQAGVASAAMASAYRALAEDASRLDEDELARSSLCGGWTRADVLFHTLLDAQRALVTFATPAAGEPDADFVSYWKPFRPGYEGSAEHAGFVRRASAAYSSRRTIARQWTETAAAAARAAVRLPADVKVATQGHVLQIGDFMATLVVEATVHHLDVLACDGVLTTADGVLAGNPRLAGPGGDGLAVVRRTLDGILGGPVPTDWDDATYALKGTGRAALTAADRARLGTGSDRFPLLG